MRLKAFLEWANGVSGPILIDGGQATEFERRGADLSVGTLWSARLIVVSPSLVKRVTRSYLVAGSDIVSTATYQATVEGIARNFSISTAKAVEVFKRGIALACAARDEFWVSLPNKNRPFPLIAGSIGSYGACLADGSEYRGDYDRTQDELEDFHKPRAQLAVQAGADLLAFETIPSDIEARAIVNIMTRESELNSVPFYISFQCIDERRLACGADFKFVSAILGENRHSQNLVALGVNCVSPLLGEAVITTLRAAIHNEMNLYHLDRRWNIRTIFYPNSGESWSQEKGWFKGSRGIDLQAWTQLVCRSKADALGGCCRTKPDHIESLRWKLRNRTSGTT